MGLDVILDGETIFSVGNGENVLVPFDEDERAKAFHALSGALAVLCGVTPPNQSAATASATDQYCSETAQYPDARTAGVVVPLRAPQADRDEPLMRK